MMTEEQADMAMVQYASKLDMVLNPTPKNGVKFTISSYDLFMALYPKADNKDCGPGVYMFTPEAALKVVKSCSDMKASDFSGVAYYYLNRYLVDKN